MLKGIPHEINPELLKALSEMGHGDSILIADGNYPAYSKGVKVIRTDNIDVKHLLKAVLKVFPLDPMSDDRAAVMKRNEGDFPPVSLTYAEILEDAGECPDICGLSRQEFYETSTKCYVIALTSDQTPYANIILKKGTIN